MYLLGVVKFFIVSVVLHHGSKTKELEICEDEKERREERGEEGEDKD